MMPELGTFALIVALLVSLSQSVLPLIGAARDDGALMRAGRNAAFAAFGLIVASFAVLVYAHVTDDFSVLNVAANSHTQKPLLYKITGAWGSHEGSMLLWILILTGYGAAMAIAPALPATLKARALAVQGMIGSGFLAFILFTSNPFERLFPIPAQGDDLNPLLQDPGLAFHPPFLYLGYVGFSSVFALAAACLIEMPASKIAAQDLIKHLRPFCLAAWGALSFGIAMGSWWAYYELGWGGYWFWDPVENAALLPWLAGTALLHALVASARRGALVRWTLLLSILAFGFSLLGTFLVRSGVLTSVHSFAVDPGRGIFMLVLLALSVGGALSLYAARAHALPESPLFVPQSREGALLVNNLFLCAACATLATGTLYPMILNALTGDIVSVGAPYFNAAVLPLMLPAALLMAFGPLLQWRASEIKPAFAQLFFAFNCAAGGAVLSLYLYGFHSVFGLFGLALGFWALGGALVDARRHLENLLPHLPRTLAHGGLGLVIIGVGGSIFSEHYNLQMRPHQILDIGGYRLEFAELNQIKGPNYDIARGTFYVTHGSHALTLEPEQRFYPSRGMPLSHVAIATNLLADTYLAMGEETVDERGMSAREVRFQINPLVPWIWIGGAVMALGGVIGAAQRAKRRLAD